MLDENARLIEVVGAKQNEGKARPASPLRPHPHSRPAARALRAAGDLQVDECSQYLAKLHSNLYYLAALADTQQAQVLQREQHAAAETQVLAVQQAAAAGATPAGAGAAAGASPSGALPTAGAGQPQPQPQPQLQQQPAGAAMDIVQQPQPDGGG